MAERRIPSQLFDGTESFVAVFPNVLPPEEVLADGAGMPLATADGGGGGALWGSPFLSMPAKVAVVVIALAALRSALRK